MCPSTYAAKKMPLVIVRPMDRFPTFQKSANFHSLEPEALTDPLRWRGVDSNQRFRESRLARVLQPRRGAKSRI